MSLKVEFEDKLMKSMVEKEISKLDIESLFRSEISKYLKTKTNISIGEKKLSAWYRERIARIIDRDFIEILLEKENITKESLIDSILKRLDIEGRIEKFLTQYLDRLSHAIKSNIFSKNTSKEG
jgi:actin-like ATPase involved in cell morphogenesis